jgi:Tc5 transposase-like DNA-binding protein/Psq-like protein
MPSKQPHWDYSKDSIANAILDITNNHVPVRQAAQKWGVPRSTISGRLGDKIALGDQIQPNQLLTRNQEAKLASWVLRQESLGYAPSHSQICACVLALQKQQGSKIGVGCNWVPKFIRRHPELRTKVGRHQESNQFNSFMPKAVH